MAFCFVATSLGASAQVTSTAPQQKTATKAKKAEAQKKLAPPTVKTEKVEAPPAPQQKAETKEKKAETQKKLAPPVVKKDKVAPAAASDAHLKKDGTVDKRFKANKHLKKDGTPDKRFKEHKTK